MVISCETQVSFTFIGAIIITVQNMIINLFFVVSKFNQFILCCFTLFDDAIPNKCLMRFKFLNISTIQRVLTGLIWILEQSSEQVVYRLRPCAQLRACFSASHILLLHEATNLDLRKLITIARNRENWRELLRVVTKDHYRSDGSRWQGDGSVIFRKLKTHRVAKIGYFVGYFRHLGCMQFFISW